MSDKIRSILFILAIIVLVVYFLPGRPSIEIVLENVLPVILPLIIFLGFIFKLKGDAKKKGVTFDSEKFKKFTSEIKESFGNQAFKKQQTKNKPTNILKEFEKFINRSN